MTLRGQSPAFKDLTVQCGWEAATQTSRQIWVPVSGRRVERWKPCGGVLEKTPGGERGMGGPEGREDLALQTG